MLSTRMFKTKTSRTLLTVLGMGVGISAVLFLVSLGYGLQKTILEKITTSDSLLALDVLKDKSSASVLNPETLEKMREITEVSEIVPISNIKSQGRISELSADLSAISSKPSYFRLSGIKLQTGHATSDEKPLEVVVSSSLARVFGLDIDEIIGKKMTFSFEIEPDKKNISGPENEKPSKNEKISLDKEFEIAGVVEGEDNVVYINSSSLENLGIVNFDQLKVKCVSDKALGEVREKISAMGFSVSSLSDMVDQVNKIFDVAKMALLFFGFIALVVSSIGMFNTMTVSLMERTEEIGIMKAIGASNLNISLIFLLEAAIMGFSGGVIGVAIGWLEGLVLGFAVNLAASHLGGESMHLFYTPWWFALAVIVFSTLIGFGTGILPARRITKIETLSALRYK